MFLKAQTHPMPSVCPLKRVFLAVFKVSNFTDQKAGSRTWKQPIPVMFPTALDRGALNRAGRNHKARPEPTTVVYIDEPPHEKTCLCHMRTTKAQISLRICSVWSAPLLFAAWIVYYLQFLYPKFEASS